MRRISQKVPLSICYTLLLFSQSTLILSFFSINPSFCNLTPLFFLIIKKCIKIVWLLFGKQFGKLEEHRPALVSAHPPQKILGKKPHTQSLKQVHRSPRWRMKDKWHAYFSVKGIFRYELLFKRWWRSKLGEIAVFQTTVKDVLYWINTIVAV